MPVSSELISSRFKYIGKEGIKSGFPFLIKRDPGAAPGPAVLKLNPVDGGFNVVYGVPSDIIIHNIVDVTETPQLTGGGKRVKYEKRTIAHLKECAVRKGLKVTSKMNKSQLIALLRK